MRNNTLVRASPSDAPSPSDALFISPPAPNSSLQIGPICILDATKDKGRGLGASRAIKVGEIVAVESPLAVISEAEIDFEEEDDSESDLLELKFEALQKKLLGKKYSKNEIEWIRSLATMKDEETGVAPAPFGSFPDLTTDRGNDETLPFPDSVDVEGLIQVNSFEADSEDKDLAYSVLQKPPRLEVMGIWPRFSIMNHSCQPNTISYAHNGQLVTVATRAVAKGNELTTNYIGDMVMSPVDVRREALEDTYGFVCQCHRCRDEDGLDANMKDLIENIYESSVDQIREDFEKAIDEEDEEAIDELHDQLRAFIEVLDASFEKATKLKSGTQTFIQASLFELYELLSSTLEAKGEVDARLLELLAALCGAIQPGSDLHLYYSRLSLEEAQAEEDKEEIQRALNETTSAYSTRYGLIGRKMLKSILKQRETFEATDDDE